MEEHTEYYDWVTIFLLRIINYYVNDYYKLRNLLRKLYRIMHIWCELWPCENYSSEYHHIVYIYRVLIFSKLVIFYDQPIQNFKNLKWINIIMHYVISLAQSLQKTVIPYYCSWHLFSQLCYSIIIQVIWHHWSRDQPWKNSKNLLLQIPFTSVNCED